MTSYLSYMYFDICFIYLVIFYISSDFLSSFWMVYMLENEIEN